MAVLEIREIMYAYTNGKPVLSNINTIFGNGQNVRYSWNVRFRQNNTVITDWRVGCSQKGEILLKRKTFYKKGLENHRRNHVSLIFQSYNLIDYMTSIENVELTAKQDILLLLERLGLTTEEAKRNVMKLSGGQQQRVAIARALASDTPIILADEPTGNLDKDTAGDITEILKESAHKLNKCVIVVTHSNELAAQADTILKLEHGSLHII